MIMNVTCYHIENVSTRTIFYMLVEYVRQCTIQLNYTSFRQAILFKRDKHYIGTLVCKICWCRIVQKVTTTYN